MTFFNLYILIFISGCILQLSFITCDSHGYLKAAVLLKGLASMCFVAIGIFAIITIMPKYQGNQLYPILICSGLVFGAIGDVGLALRHTIKTKNLIFHLCMIIGILFFLLGHICYLSASVINVGNIILYCLLAVVCALVFCYFFFKKLTTTKSYKLLGLIYICVLFCFVFCTCGKVIEFITIGETLERGVGLSFFLMAIASVIFTISDILTAYNSFGPKVHPTMRLFSLSFYYAAQMIIATSLIFLIN